MSLPEDTNYKPQLTDDGYDEHYRNELARRMSECAWIPQYGLSGSRKRIAVECTLNLLDEMINRLPGPDRRSAIINLTEGLKQRFYTGRRLES